MLNILSLIQCQNQELNPRPLGCDMKFDNVKLFYLNAGI